MSVRTEPLYWKHSNRRLFEVDYFVMYDYEKCMEVRQIEDQTIVARFCNFNKLKLYLAAILCSNYSCAKPFFTLATLQDLFRKLSDKNNRRICIL